MTSEREQLSSTAKAVFQAEVSGDNQSLTLLSLLARGEPVTVEALASAHGRPVADVRAALDASPDIEYDKRGHIIGAGLTQRPTPHQFEINGRTLYTWCAMDTLIYPRLLGLSARVMSPCHATGTPIRLAIDNTGVTHLDPPTAVVSLVTPDDLSSVRTAFCAHVHFFASHDAALPWQDQHPDAFLLPVTEAYDLGDLTSSTPYGPACGVCC